VIVFKKNYEVICIINFKNRTQKYKVIAFKKIKKTFKDVTRGGAWVSPFMKQNLNRT
jgi:hypothetical protein